MLLQNTFRWSMFLPAWIGYYIHLLIQHGEGQGMQKSWSFQAPATLFNSEY